jgi:hypothetical protein
MGRCHRQTAASEPQRSGLAAPDYGNDPFPVEKDLSPDGSIEGSALFIRRAKIFEYSTLRASSRCCQSA